MIKFISRRRVKLTGLLIGLCCLSLLAAPAFARSVIIQTNSVDIVPGTGATGGTATFTDSVDGAFSVVQAITNGALDPGGAFLLHDLGAGTISLSLSALDINVPGYNAGEVVTRTRTRSLSHSYPAIPGVEIFTVSTWLSSIQDTPPPVLVKASQIGFDLNLKPVIQVTIESPSVDPYTVYYDPSHYSTSGSGYHYKTVSGAIGVEKTNTAKAEFTLDPNKYDAGKTYSIIAYAYNGYTFQHGGDFDPKWSASVDFTTVAIPDAGGPITIIYDFDKITDGLGVNQFSIPLEIGSFQYDIGDGQETIDTVKKLVLSINVHAEGGGMGSNLVKSIGWWDAATQKAVGYTVNYSGDMGLVGTDGLAVDGNELLVRDRVYQINVGAIITGFKLIGNRGD